MHGATPRPGSLLDTHIGKKAALAVSGLVLFGFVIAHMAGNLQVFLGPEAFNGYAAMLKGMPGLLWGARSVLVLSLIVHVVTMIQLYRVSLAARGVRYRKVKRRATGYASSTMHFTGPMLFFYIAFHLAHFTAPGLALGEAPFSHTDVYTNFVSSFSVPWVTALYVVANLLLGLHLHHGAFSLLQTLGLSHPRYDRARNWTARSVALVVTAGNVALPLSVIAGVVGP